MQHPCDVGQTQAIQCVDYRVDVVFDRDDGFVADFVVVGGNAGRDMHFYVFHSDLFLYYILLRCDKSRVIRLNAHIFGIDSDSHGFLSRLLVRVWLVSRILVGLDVADDGGMMFHRAPGL